MFIVEGNIGAGKTTLLKLIHEHFPTIRVLFEPVNRWDKSQTGMSLLHDFYDNPSRWAYTLETYVMICRVKDHLQDLEEKNVIHVMERSLFSGYYVFVKNCYMRGYMTTLEWQLYQQWFDFLTQQIPVPDGFIYLRTTPAIAYERTLKRKRASEHAITFDYIQAIHDRHEEFLIAKEGVTSALKHVPVLLLNGDLSFESDVAIQEDFMQQIKQFIQKHNDQKINH